MHSAPKPELRQFGPLNAIEYRAPKGSLTIICLHGYGANAADLASLAIELDLPKQVRWIFPNAPLAIQMIEGGRAWFPINEARMMTAQVEGHPIDLANERPLGMDEALKSLLSMIEAVSETWDRLMLGGFSQASMMALEAALKAPVNPKGMFLLSGTLVDETGLRALAPMRSGFEFFQSHGTFDPLLGFESAKKLHAILNGAGMRGSFSEFEGGHGVAPETIQDFLAYLKKIIDE